MITKKEIIEVLLDYGCSPIEIERVTDSKDNFALAIQCMIEQIRFEEKTK